MRRLERSEERTERFGVHSYSTCIDRAFLALGDETS